MDSIIKRKRPIVAPVIVKTKKVPDYSLGKIYKITSPNCDEVYIGSTICTLKERLKCHKSACKTTNCNSKVVIDKGDAIIELIEDFPCENRTELERREGEIMKATLNCCNERIAGRTVKEYYEDNVIIIIEQKKQYRIENADKIRKQKQQFRIDNPDIMRERDRQYRLNQKAKLNPISDVVEVYNE